jgi:hypothetical protein
MWGVSLMRKDTSSEQQFDPPHLSKREAGVLRSALIKYAKDCDARFHDADTPQDAYMAAKEGETARELVARIARREQSIGRPAQNSTLRTIR